MKRRYLNGEALLEGLLCLAFSGALLYLTYSGKYLLFVTPRMKPYLYFTAAVMLLWAVSRLAKAGTPRYRQNKTRCLVLALPLLVLLLPYKALDAGSTQAGYTKMAAKTEGNDTNAKGDTKTNPDKEGAQQGKTQEETQESTQPPEESPAAGQDAGQDAVQGTGQDNSQGTGQDNSQGSGQGSSGNGPETVVPSGLDEAGRTITVSDEEFYQWLTELSYHPEKYEGFTVHMHGTVYRDETLAENEFAVTRLVMSCCAADLAPCGPLCLMDGAADLTQDQWVDVTGTYHYDKNKGMEITVNGIEDAEPAEEEYVYPFSY